MASQISFVISLASISVILGCPYQTDLVFLLDGSESVSESAFLQQKAFVVVNTATLQMTAPSFRHLHVGVEVFSSDVSVITELDKPADPDTFSNFVLAAAQPRDGTRTNMALKTLRYMFSQQSRQNTLLKAVLITDGYSKNIAKTIEEARMARNMGVDFIFVGIGGSIKFEEVAALVDDKSKVFLLNTFDELASVSDEVRNAICSGTPVLWQSKRARSEGTTWKTRTISETYIVASSTTFAPTMTKMDSVATSSMATSLQTFVTQTPVTSNGMSTTIPLSSSNRSTVMLTIASPTSKSPTSQETITATVSTSSFTTDISNTTHNPTTQIASATTTSTPSTTSTSTSPPTTFMTSTTTRQLVQQDHFTLIPLGLLAGLGGSETLLDLLRGSNHDISNDNSFGMKIPLPLFIAKTPSVKTTSLALNRTLPSLSTHSNATSPSDNTSPTSKTSTVKSLMTLNQSFTIMSPTQPTGTKTTPTNLLLSTSSIATPLSSVITTMTPSTPITTSTTPMSTITTLRTSTANITSTAPSTQSSIKPTTGTLITSTAIPTTPPSSTTSPPSFTKDAPSTTMEKAIRKEGINSQMYFETTNIYIHPECLRVSPDPEDPTQYFEKVGTLTHRRRCARGVAFDPITCTCALKFIVGFTQCRPDLVLTFSHGIKDESGSNTFVLKKNNVQIIENEARFFADGSLETWRFNNAIQESLTIRFRFFPWVHWSKEKMRRAMIGNCDAYNRKSYSIEVDEMKHHVVFTIHTSHGFSIIRIPYTSSKWNSVQMVYDNKQLHCQVNDLLEQRPLTGSIKTSNEPMVIGACDSSLLASYYGVMDDIYVYMCAVPKPET
ncbi:serine-rich adhesin for platelets-like [Haliotis rufescens]|uniref:serine-rich adhesin for platelets-like n=1 Tax=Haliotis rufescens TaxID=6454 RepID=UPI001EB01B4E|nr:serine-rich adhesin for platelets-like [Haliotis rufescens]